ncbi:hypothetical protein AGMMS49960_17060 [Betaproteobacteria bacterium]|nr:hypothetical protein AGMMS49543_07280 [Betaproteobacteria bacterium]GHU03164.1 hypothetical protein AGMMS49960_17060 [Betaproteobacteria bacterium]GHU19749.1 hypothetical protein AGMMS50243_12540 [Betaproteobacteria bacterium]
MNAPTLPARPDCYRCAAFFITHNPAFPYGCRAIGCQSKRLPGAEVLEASGQSCLMFTPKPPPGRNPRMGA